MVSPFFSHISDSSRLQSTQSPVTVTRTTGAVQPDQDFSECSQMGTAMRTIFNNDVNQYQAFMNGCGSQMETIGTELSNAMVGRASANAVCNNRESQEPGVVGPVGPN